MQNRESKHATTNNKPKFDYFSKAKVFFFLWNILSISLYSCYTFFVIYRMTEKTFLSKIIIYLLFAYAFVFVLLLIISLGNRKKMRSRLKNYQSATKFLKYIIQILNLTLSIITTISAFFTSGKADFNTFFYAIGSMLITFLFILFEIIKIIIRKNIPLIKHNFLEMRDKVDSSYNQTEDN